MDKTPIMVLAFISLLALSLIPAAGLLIVSPTNQTTGYVAQSISINATGGSSGAVYNWSSIGSCPGFGPVLAGTTNSFNYTPTGPSLNCRIGAVDNMGDNPGVSNTIIILWNVNGVSAANTLNAPNIIETNIPWFFPFLTLVLLIMVDYTFGVKKGIDSKLNFLACSIGFTILAYVEVVGSLSTTNYFFIFEFLMLIAMLFITLFGKKEP